MNTSESINEIAAALAKAQASMAKAAKDSTNPHFRSKYADLASITDACREALTANGIAVIQAPGTTDDGAVTVTTRLAHSTGQWLETTMACRPGKADAQGMGSVVSYLRRYCLAAMAGVVADDDDGEAAVGRGDMHPTAPQSRQEPRQPPKAPARVSTPANGAARASDAPTEPSAGRVAKAVAANRQPFDPEQGDDLPPELGDPKVTVVGPDGKKFDTRLTKALEWMKSKHADASIDHGAWWDAYYQPNVTWLERHAPKTASELAVRGG